MFLSLQYPKVKLSDSFLVLHLASYYMYIYINSDLGIQTDTQIGSILVSTSIAVIKYLNNKQLGKTEFIWLTILDYSLCLWRG